MLPPPPRWPGLSHSLSVFDPTHAHRNNAPRRCAFESREEELKQELNLVQDKYQEETHKVRMLQERMIEVKRKRGASPLHARNGGSHGASPLHGSRTPEHVQPCAAVRRPPRSLLQASALAASHPAPLRHARRLLSLRPISQWTATAFPMCCTQGVRLRSDAAALADAQSLRRHDLSSHRAARHRGGLHLPPQATVCCPHALAHVHER